MGDLSIVALCHALANITHNRCSLVENSHVCRCDDTMGTRATGLTNPSPDIMFSEVLLIFLVLAIWLSAIGYCLSQYKSLRRLETQVHYCVSRKDPLNIGDIKIVSREQDSIIYKKTRYSTVLDTQINDEDLKTMKYVKEYLPKTATTPSTITALVINHDDLTTKIPLSKISTTNNSFDRVSLRSNTATTVLLEQSQEKQSTNTYPSSTTSFVILEADRNKSNDNTTCIYRAESDRLTSSLNVPRVSAQGSFLSSWNSSRTHEASCSTQHLCVPSNGLRSNRYSDGNISLPVPQISQKHSDNSDEKLIDPRLIPDVVRRSLLALHRESQENLNMQRHKEKTQSENDVHGAFTPWKMKMKSKLKRTQHHHQNQHLTQQHHMRLHSNALSSSLLQNSNDQDRRQSEYAAMSREYRFSTPPLHHSRISTNQVFRRSLKNYPKFSTQSTSESETTQGDLPMITSIYVSADDDETVKPIIETSEQSPIA